MRPGAQSKITSPEFSASSYAERHRRPLHTGARRGLPPDVKLRPTRNAAPTKLKEKRRKESTISPEAKARLFRASLALLGVFVLVGGAVAAYQSFSASGWFTLRRVDLQGVTNVPREDLMRRLSPYLSGSLWQVDLAAVRSEMERQPGVMKAEVVRVLPDTLRVSIEERKPVAPVRRESGAVVWVDQEGVAIGEHLHVKIDRVPPVVSGLDEGDGPAVVEKNRRRMEVYQKLMAEMSQSPSLREEIDEVNLSDVHSARLQLGQRRVAVIVGEEEFLPRLKKALEVLDQVNHGNFSGVLRPSDAERLAQGARIAYLNVTRPDRVIVGLD